VDDTTWDSLDWNWGSAYRITNPEPGVWLAQRRDDRTTLRAESAEELSDMIQADYAKRPVPRDTE
jgi:hypothetical protein